MNRYPAPDPSDPWAPLWVLRSKAATASSRPSTAESAPLPPPVTARSTRPRSSPGYLSGSASRPFDSRRRYTVTTPSTTSPLASSVVLSASPPQSPRSSHSRPSLPSPLDAISQEENRQQTPEIGSKDQARARELVDVRVHDKARKRSQGKFSRMFLGSIKTSTSTSSTPGHKEKRSSPIALPRKRTSSQPGPSPQHHHQNHYQHAHSHHRALSSKGRPTISSPVISTLVWESQMTDRKFVPIAASPIVNNATSVQQPQPQQQNVGTPFNGALNDTSANPAGMAIVGSDARCYTNGIKSPIPSTSSRPLSPPHHWPSSDMHDDSGVELQDPQDRPVPSASPLTPRKRVPSLILSPITVTASQRSSQSSYFEVFSTPCASPVESEDTLKEGASQPTTIAAPLPSSPFGPPRSPLSSPNTVLLHPPMPDTNTSATQTPQSASSTKAQCLCSTTSPVPIFRRPMQTEWSIPSTDQLAYAASLPVYQTDGTPIEFGSLFTEHRIIVLFLRHFFCPMCQDYAQDLAELIKQPAFKETGALCPFDEEDARVPPKNGDEDDEGQALPKQVQLVLVSCGKASLVDKYKSMFDLPFRMFTDPEMKVYEALGMGKMGRSGGSGVGMGGGGGSVDKPHHSAQHAHTAAHAEVVEKDVIMTAAAEGDAEKNLVTEVEEPLVRTISPMATVTRRSIDNSNSNGSSYVKHGLMGGIGMVVMRALKAGMPIWENGGDIAQLGGEFVLGPGMTCAFAHRMQHPKGHAPVLEVLKAANVNIPDEIMRTLGVSRATSLTSISDSDMSSMEFAPPSTVRGVPGPSKPTVPQGKENKLNKKKSSSFSGLSISASTVRRSGSFKTLSSLVSPSPPLHSASLHGHGSSSNARGMKRLGISSSSIDGHPSPSSRGKKSTRPQQRYRTHSSTLSQILGLGSDRNEDRHTRSAPAVTEPRPSKKVTIITSSSDTRSLMDAEEEQKWMESRQRDLEVLRLRKDTRRRTGTPGSVSLSLGSGRASASMSSPVKGVEAEHGGGLLGQSQEHDVAGSPSSEVDSGYGTGPSNTNGRSAGGVDSGKGHIVDENGVLIRPRGEVFVHELPLPSEDGDTIKTKSKSRTKSFSASVRRIFKV